MTHLEIRPARPEDAAEIAGIHVRSWQAAYRGLIDQSILDSLSIEDRTTQWAKNIADPMPTILGTLVAVRDGVIVAWTSFGTGRDPEHDDDGEVYGIYADPRAWSTGAGHALLVAAEQQILDAGHPNAYLWVLDGNTRADSFYERHGWVEDGAMKLDERPGVTLTEHRRVKVLGG